MSLRSARKSTTWAAAAGAGSRTTRVAPRAGGASDRRTRVRGDRAADRRGVDPEVRQRADGDLLGPGGHDPLERRVARLAERLRARDESRHRPPRGRRSRSGSGAGRGPGRRPGRARCGRRTTGTAGRSAWPPPAGTTPAPPSDVSTPARARSNSRPPSAAARTRAVDTVHEPARTGSVTRTPRAAPIASALRIVSGAFDGAIDRRVTSPPWASTSLSAASRAYSSLPLTTAGDGGPVEPTVRPEPLAGGRRDPARA